MLNIIFGTTDDTIIPVSAVFNNNYEEEWFEDQFVKDMILDVDKSEVISPYCIASPVLGQIAPERLSGGVKALILMYKTDFEIWATACGDNCAKWILKIAEKKDLTISLEHYMRFPYEDFAFKNMSTGETSNNYLDSVLDYVKELHTTR